MTEPLLSISDGVPFHPMSAYIDIRKAVETAPTTALPSAEAVQCATSKVTRALPLQGKGDDFTLHHILNDVVPGFNGSSLSQNYYGFVTGGVLPIAEAADNIVSAFDQNAAVHIPSHSVCTTVENAALHMLLQLLELENETGSELDSEQASVVPTGVTWDGTFTTGATGGNVLGLLCGRESIIAQRLAEIPGHDVGDEVPSVGEMGLLRACTKAGIKEIQVLTTVGHSSLYKAASIVGIGRECVIDVSVPDEPGTLDWKQLEDFLKLESTASIVSVSAGDVNTGRFATSVYADMARLAELCRQYKAWLHVDGAFGLFARALPNTPEFEKLREHCKGLELANSIAGDAHKCLNVPYDCGFFLTSKVNILTAVCKNPNAPYLSSSGPSNIHSPLNISLENSRRFRALPIYAVLLSHGAKGMAEMFARQVRLTRKVAAYLDEHDGYELLPRPREEQISWAVESKKAEAERRTAIKPNYLPREDFSETHIIALFSAKDKKINKDLVERINAPGTIYVSGTVWEKEPAVRVAVSTWKVDVERDFEIIKGVLENALR